MLGGLNDVRELIKPQKTAKLNTRRRLILGPENKRKKAMKSYA